MMTTTIDAVIVGSGLAGLSAALTILDAGGSVVVIEKEAKLGGNSMKASSGINACPSPNDQQVFRKDTLSSAGCDDNNNNDDVVTRKTALIDTLVQHSSKAVLGWLQKRLDVDLSQVARLGGHSNARTHRPGGKMPVGAEIMVKLQGAVKAFEETGKIQILTSSKVTEFLKNAEDGTVAGVVYETKSTTSDSDNNGGTAATITGRHEIKANYVVLATGGFASDRSEGSWLAKYRPELLSLGATAGEFSTGDGLTLATSVKAGLVDMEQIQVHPTGFVDPKDPDNPNKFLAPEVLRGVGGLLFNAQGRRFCNEIGRRDYVTDKILSLNNEKYAQTKKWDPQDPVPRIYILLSEEAAATIPNEIGFYTWKGFLTKVTGVKAVAQYMGLVDDPSAVQEDLLRYQQQQSKKEDEFGNTLFLNIPKCTDDGVMYVGTVTPVLHYCMGGVTINPKGQVLDDTGNVIPNLHACGEVSGGLHGKNRLAGNSLCECVVFGRIVGQSIVDDASSSSNNK